MSMFLIAFEVLLAALLFAPFLHRFTFNPTIIKGLKVAITGASTGIGEEIAYFYARHGAEVLIIARNEERMKKVAEKCKQLGAKQAQFMKADMSANDEKYYYKVIDDAVKMLGGLDTLVLNHVVTKDIFIRTGHYKNFDLERVKWMYQVNVFSYMALAQAATEELETNKGKIIVLGSFAGKVGIARISEYASSKHAIVGYFDSLRLDFAAVGSNVSITTCTLGSIKTENAAKHALEERPESALYPPNKCARAIVYGGESRVRDVYYPVEQIMPLLWIRFLPDLVDEIIKRIL